MYGHWSGCRCGSLKALPSSLILWAGSGLSGDLPSREGREAAYCAGRWGRPGIGGGASPSWGWAKRVEYLRLTRSAVLSVPLIEGRGRASGILASLLFCEGFQLGGRSFGSSVLLSPGRICLGALILGRVTVFFLRREIPLPPRTSDMVYYRVQIETRKVLVQRVPQRWMTLGPT